MKSVEKSASLSKGLRRSFNKYAAGEKEMIDRENASVKYLEDGKLNVAVPIKRS